MKEEEEGMKRRIVRKKEFFSCKKEWREGE
jgi:hypothetical protein